MKDRPDITELLELSRSLLRNELRTALPEEHKYTALMVANVIGIAIRKLRQEGQEEKKQIEELAQIIKQLRPDQGSAKLENQNLDEMYAELCSAIREGKFDTPGRNSEELRKFLLEWTEKRVGLYNPRAIE